MMKVKAMDGLFWIGISIGFILSILASIIANLYSDRIRSYLERVGLSLRATQFEKDKKLYNEISLLAQGRRDRCIFFLRQMMMAVVFLLLSVIVGVITVLLKLHFDLIGAPFPIAVRKAITEFGQLDGQEVNVIVSIVWGLLLMLTSGWLGALSFIRFSRYAFWLENYKEFSDSMERKWGYLWQS